MEKDEMLRQKEELLDAALDAHEFLLLKSTAGMNQEEFKKHSRAIESSAMILKAQEREWKREGRIN